MQDFRLETLDEFRKRTNSFNQTSLPERGMITGVGLSKKVSPTGRLLRYEGSTVVFKLPDAVKTAIAGIQKMLYEVCSDVLADPLSKDTFHITLHDLVSGKPSSKLSREIKQIEPMVLRRVGYISAQEQPIRMKSTYLFNMVNTSMVLGFEPEDEDSCYMLMEYYQELQQELPLNYLLTPHVTLAYFRPGEIRPDQIKRLQSVVDRVKECAPIYIELMGCMAEYTLFTDMNHYKRGNVQEFTDAQLIDGLIRNLNDSQLLEMVDALVKEPELAQAFKWRIKSMGKDIYEKHIPIEITIQKAIEKSEGRTRLFYQELLKFVERRGMKDSKVYGAIDMDRKLWYRLRDDEKASTGKENVLKMCIVLHLDYWETFYLVNLSGHSFTPYADMSVRDFVIGLCVTNGEYDPYRVDELLVKAGEKALFGQE